MRYIYFIATILLLASCGNDSEKPDVSDIKVEITLERFEKDFFSIDTNALDQSLTALNKKYPRFYPSFTNDILMLHREHRILPDGNVMINDTGKAVIRSFYRGYATVHESIQQQYKNLNWLQEDLREAFRYVKYYYPAYTVPSVITFLGTFDAPGMIITPKYLGIGL